MKTLTITVQELNDRTEIRVWKSLVSGVLEIEIDILEVKQNCKSVPN